MSGKKLTGEDGVLTPLIKELVETALSAEVESHIAHDALSVKANRRNGYNSKTVKTHSDSFIFQSVFINACRLYVLKYG